MDPGIYELLVTEALHTRLGHLDSTLRPTRALHSAEAADRIALHLSREIERSLEALPDKDRVKVGIEIARQLIQRLSELAETDTSAAPVEPGEVLHAILEKQPDGTPRTIT